MKKVAIIGGGASGIFGAIRLKQLFNNNIDFLFFANSKIGRKLRNIFQILQVFAVFIHCCILFSLILMLYLK